MNRASRLLATTAGLAPGQHDMKKAIVLIAACAALAGCGLKHESTAPAEQARDHQVRELFTHDGCTVVEFWARSQWRYYAKCGGQAADTFWQQTTGKTTRPDGVAGGGMGLKP